MRILTNISFQTLAVVAYHLVVLTDVGFSLTDAAIQITLVSAEMWTMRWGDVLVAGSVALQYGEIIKSTRTSRAAIIDHVFSLVLFIVCLVEFLVADFAATSTFFLITLMILLDVVGGFTITITGARRDFGGVVTG